jgi:hypothetical protein
VNIFLIWFEIIGILILRIREGPNWNSNRILEDSSDGRVVGIMLTRFNLVGRGRLRLCKSLSPARNDPAILL